ncbi:MULTISPECIES: murein biosynthesis integral membrane protein MurJ [unclassified Streptomyces]|uniref:murein biosynthesis integral membrane protein MurJ n=1 Tax=unclassified Streptomyces TaxID=2593676 RepID=UPI00226EFDC2|nr:MULTISPECIES: murein biosynthesis integral membrane protein MurJ [unclassified Streptomyces]MCY0918386.1 murein biosynthesis integral membrane protein MurJ [Streptomyces sp. H27-G5]MCY0958547.1 murein biosynthesis integral membrane protein MurJ [Streptomyces sp. H27-H5]
MNAPYDGDRAQGTGGPSPAQGAAPGTPVPGQVPPPAPAPDHDPYVQDAYDYDPYRSQDLSAQDPVTEVMYDRASHPPPPPGTYQEAGPLYAAPQAPSHGPDPRVWAQTPPPEPDGPSRHMPYGDHATTTRFVGVDSLVTETADDQPAPDAFAHLYRDQEAVPRTVTEEAPVATPAPTKPAGKASGLLKSSALMAAGTIVSRITGFLRTLVIGGAIGVVTLNDTYQVANTLPTMIYVLVGGGALNAVFIPQLVRAMKNDEDGGEAYANRLLTLVMVLLGAVTVICVLAAPVFITMMSPTIADNPDRMDVAVSFAHYCLPTMFFMGVHVVLGQILNARGRFGAMMWTPVLNNVVVIATFGAFIWAFGGFTSTGMNESGITPEGVRLLGLGTLLGLVVQSLAMIPYLRDAGFRPRLRFDWKGHGLGKAAGLAKWTFFFVLANQIGLVVVTQLATWAGEVAAKQGHGGTGITGYNYALLLWQMPQAIITVSVMTAVLPRISRSAHDGDAAAVRDDISYGLRTSAVAIVPCAFAFLALGVPMATLLYAGSGADDAQNIGFILMAFGLGLIPYSVQYVVLRGFYAYEDTRTPFYNTVIVAAVNAGVSVIAFLVLPERWAVVGMAAAYGLGYAVGVGVAWRRLRTRLGGDLDGAHVMRTYTRLIGACVPAAAVAGAVAYGVTQWLGNGAGGSLAALVTGFIALAAVFLVAAKRMRVEELNSMVGMVRGRLGR